MSQFRLLQRSPDRTPCNRLSPSCWRQRPSTRAFPFLTVVAAALLALWSPTFAQPSSVTSEAFVDPTLTVHPQNRRYFMRGNTCEAIYLAGTHHSNNLQDWGSTRHRSTSLAPTLQAMRDRLTSFAAGTGRGLDGEPPQIPETPGSCRWPSRALALVVRTTEDFSST